MSETKTKNRIRICVDCRQAPAKGIRSIRCLECHQAHIKAKTKRWNAERSRKARANWSPICEIDGCSQPKYNTRFATKYCGHHRDVMKKQHADEYRQRRREDRIANPGRCQNPGCDRDAFSYKAKYCTPCRKELRRSSNAIYRESRAMAHDEKNIQIVQHVRDRLNEIVNEAAQVGSLSTAECHRMGTVLLQLRSWATVNK